METKKCTKCAIFKHIDQFFKSGKYLNGKIRTRGNCKECASKETTIWRKENRAAYNEYMAKYRIQNPDKIRAHEIKKLYGLFPEDLMKMVNEQNNKCKICERSPSGKRPLAIDHCHKTGRVRGLLCYNCNRLISLLDDQLLLNNAMNYIKI